MKYKILLLSIVLGALIATAAKAQDKQPLDLSIKVYGSYGLFTPGGDFIVENNTLNANSPVVKIIVPVILAICFKNSAYVLLT